MLHFYPYITSKNTRCVVLKIFVSKLAMIKVGEGDYENDQLEDQ